MNDYCGSFPSENVCNMESFDFSLDMFSWYSRQADLKRCKSESWTGMTWKHLENDLVGKETESQKGGMDWGSQKWFKIDEKVKLIIFTQGEEE